LISKEIMENDAGHITSREGFWFYDFGTHFLDLRDELLPVMTQNQSAEYLSKDGFSTATLPQFIAIGGKIKELSLSQDGEKINLAKSARKFLEESIRRYGLNTQTRVAFSSEEQELITHGYGRQNPLITRANLVVPDGLVEDVLSESSSIALTHGKTPKQVAEIMSYINQTPSYFWTPHNKSRPKSTDERVVGLDAYSDGFYLFCLRGPLSAAASFGVRLRKKIRRVRIK